MYNVYQHWDKLKTCVVGKSYPPEFYKWIANPRLRGLFEKIAIETEEDYQKLIKLLESFGVKTIRPNVPDVDATDIIKIGERIPGPVSMNPRDQMIMIGSNFFMFPFDIISHKIMGIRRRKVEDSEFIIDTTSKINDWWHPILDNIESAGNTIIKDKHDVLLKHISANGITRIGKDLYFGTNENILLNNGIKSLQKKYFQDYRCHFVKTYGHSDGTYKPVAPGLIFSIADSKDDIPYDKEFPNWEIIYLSNEHWHKVKNWRELKTKNQGKWWIKGYERDGELIELVEHWLKDWLGYVEETVFDVNMLMIDKHNIICNGYNKVVFDALERYGITPHIINFRHRYFWDGGLHCITSDLDREGTMEDYFPERG